MIKLESMIDRPPTKEDLGKPYYHIHFDDGKMVVNEGIINEDDINAKEPFNGDWYYGKTFWQKPKLITEIEYLYLKDQEEKLLHLEAAGVNNDPKYGGAILRYKLKSKIYKMEKENK